MYYLIQILCVIFLLFIHAIVLLLHSISLLIFLSLATCQRLLVKTLERGRDVRASGEGGVRRLVILGFGKLSFYLSVSICFYLFLYLSPVSLNSLYRELTLGGQQHGNTVRSNKQVGRKIWINDDKCCGRDTETLTVKHRASKDETNCATVTANQGCSSIGQSLFLLLTHETA